MYSLAMDVDMCSGVKCMEPELGITIGTQLGRWVERYPTLWCNGCVIQGRIDRKCR